MYKHIYIIPVENLNTLWENQKVWSTQLIGTDFPGLNSIQHRLTSGPF